MSRQRIRLRWLPLAIAGILLAGAAPANPATLAQHPPPSTDPTVVRL